MICIPEAVVVERKSEEKYFLITIHLRKDKVEQMKNISLNRLSRN